MADLEKRDQGRSYTRTGGWKYCSKNAGSRCTRQRFTDSERRVAQPAAGADLDQLHAQRRHATRGLGLSSGRASVAREVGEVVGQPPAAGGRYGDVPEGVASDRRVQRIAFLPSGMCCSIGLAVETPTRLSGSDQVGHDFGAGSCGRARPESHSTLATTRRARVREIRAWRWSSIHDAGSSGTMRSFLGGRPTSCRASSRDGRTAAAAPGSAGNADRAAPAHRAPCRSVLSISGVGARPRQKSAASRPRRRRLSLVLAR